MTPPIREWRSPILRPYRDRTVVLYRRRAVFVTRYRAAQLHEGCHVGLVQHRIQAASWQFWRQAASIFGFVYLGSERLIVPAKYLAF